MAIPIKFDAERAAPIMLALSRGEPIPAADGGWTRNDCLLAAGALLYATAQGGPLLVHGDIAEMHAERQEHYFAEMLDDLHAAIAWNAEMCRLMVRGEYRERFENQHKVLLFADGNGKHVAEPLEGVKQSAPAE